MADELNPESPEESTEPSPTENAPEASPVDEPVPAVDAPPTAEATSDQPSDVEPAPADPAADEPVPAVPTATGEPAVGEDGEPLPELTLGEGESPAREIDPNWSPVVRGKVDERTGVATGLGRRKTSTARVRLSEGSGGFVVNGRDLTDYFPVEANQKMILAPLEATESLDQYDISVRVSGGGITGQTGAIVLGIARALQALDQTRHHALNDGGFLTRDDRMVERKKYGYKKARKSFQFSKR